MNACILHDQFRVMGGAERVAVEMARALDAPILAARVDDAVPPDDVEIRQLFDGLPARMMHQHYLVQDFTQMFTWQHQPDLNEYDVVICNKTNPLWYVPGDHQTVLGYLHSTPRGFYDRFDEQNKGLIPRIITTAMKALFESNRIEPDAWATNSDLTQRRAALYWNRRRNTRVIYPPVPVSDYSADDARTRDYYLAFGRLRDHKRFGEVIRAFQGTDYQLVIGGDGPQREELEEMAAGHDNIELVGYMSEEAKQRRLSEAKAHIMNAENEDFGITPIESFGAGTPVLGVREGFTQHQVVDGVNGMLYERGDLQDCVETFEKEGVGASPEAIEEFADEFAVDRFHDEIREWVRRNADDARVDTVWHPEDRDRTQTALADGGDGDA